MLNVTTIENICPILRISIYIYLSIQNPKSNDTKRIRIIKIDIDTISQNAKIFSMGQHST